MLCINKLCFYLQLLQDRKDLDLEPGSVKSEYRSEYPDPEHCRRFMWGGGNLVVSHNQSDGVSPEGGPAVVSNVAELKLFVSAPTFKKFRLPLRSRLRPRQ